MDAFLFNWIRQGPLKKWTEHYLKLLFYFFLKKRRNYSRINSVQKHKKTLKNVHRKYLLNKKRASQGLIFQKTCKNVQKTCKNVQNVHLKCFWTLFKNVHCQGPCISRPYCIMVQDFFKNLTKMALKTFLDLKIMWQLKSKKFRGCQISPY